MRLKENKIACEVMSPGMVSGRLMTVELKAPEYEKKWICTDEIESEKKRFLKAIRDCREQTELISRHLESSNLGESGSVLSAHSLLFEDELLVNNTLREIESFSVNAEWALSRTVNEIRDVFLTLPQGYISDRIHDINFIEISILLKLLGKKNALSLSSPKSRILCIHHPSPVDIVSLSRQHTLGLITSAVGYNSHTAIMARSLGLPLFNVKASCFSFLSSSSFVLMDGDDETLVVNPTSRKMSKYRKERRRHLDANQKLLKEARKNSVTADGVNVALLGNVEFDEETRMIARSGGNGVGLFRTEFMFGREEGDWNEASQLGYYQKLLKHASLGEVTIRTLDIGGDKAFDNRERPLEANPALGMRAIRLYSQNKNLFEVQIRAILKAYEGKQKLKICFPMISTASEFKKLKKEFLQIAAKLKKLQWIKEKKICLGAMLEVPSLVYEIDLLADDADFISIGSNDLIQYFLAVDRTNESVAHLYNPYHPAVVRILCEIIKKADAHHLEVTFCGEIATEPQYLFLLLLMGYRRFSMYPMAIPRIKNTIRSLLVKKSGAVLDKICRGASQGDVEEAIKKAYGEALIN